MVTRKEWSRRSGRKSVSERLPAGVADRIRARDHYRCVYCGVVEGDVRHHLDHIVPRCHGGLDEATNLIVACVRCNTSRKSMPLGEWARYARQKHRIKIDVNAVLAQAHKPLPVI
jgi:5-methylcytosine-specific restriction endonuclease McrA